MSNALCVVPSRIKPPTKRRFVSSFVTRQPGVPRQSLSLSGFFTSNCCLQNVCLSCVRHCRVSRGQTALDDDVDVIYCSPYCRPGLRVAIWQTDREFGVERRATWVAATGAPGASYIVGTTHDEKTFSARTKTTTQIILYTNKNRGLSCLAFCTHSVVFKP